MRIWERTGETRLKLMKKPTQRGLKGEKVVRRKDLIASPPPEFHRRGKVWRRRDDVLVSGRNFRERSEVLNFRERT